MWKLFPFVVVCYKWSGISVSYHTLDRNQIQNMDRKKLLLISALLAVMLALVNSNHLLEATDVSNLIVFRFFFIIKAL